MTPQFNQSSLYELSGKLFDEIEFLLDKLGVEYKILGNRYCGRCPIHSGDNQSAFSIFNGTWSCYTHHCEKYFARNMIGLVRGVLSRKNYDWKEEKDKKQSFESTLKWIFSFLKIDQNDVKSYNKVDSKFITNNNLLYKNREVNESKITRGQVRSFLKFPATPFINRGFKEEILNSYDIGLYFHKGKPMFNRVVVPIYDDDHQFMVGCLGRAIAPLCEKCNLYHKYQCPTYNQQMFHKWINSVGLRKSSYLFNYWKAKDSIKKEGKVIIVEGPLDVLRLEQEGIKNSVAIFGSNMSDEQTILLERLPIEHIIILTDNDESGNNARSQIKEQCKHLCYTHFPSFNSHDIADSKIEEINQIKEFIEKL